MDGIRRRGVLGLIGAAALAPTARAADFDWKRFSGTSLRFMVSVHPWTQWAQTQLPALERDTGIKLGWVEGVEAIDRKLRQLLESEGLRAIEVKPGMSFDPREHEALVNVPGTDFPEGTIVSELQRGYRIRDRILRPARVAIAAGPEAGTADDAVAPRIN